MLRWIALFIAGFALATALVGLMLVSECQPEDWNQITKIKAAEGNNGWLHR